MYAVRRANATVIAASRFVARQFESVVPSPVRVIYNGAPDLGLVSKNFFAGKIRVGMLGRIAPEKGQLDFVRASRLIGGDSATFTIYGDSLFSDPGYARKVQAEAATAPVEFQGWREDVGSVYRELDILAVPSFAREASTRVIMEAFSAGVAVVAYAAGGIPEIVDHGRTGLLTGVPRFDALATSLGDLMADRNKMETLALAGRIEWKERFSREHFQNSICEVIDSVWRSGGDRAMRSNRDPGGAQDSEYPRDRNPPAVDAHPAKGTSYAPAGTPSGEAGREPAANSPFAPDSINRGASTRC
jgi:glycosyltransferase involved in cell wall biosynthesis